MINKAQRLMLSSKELSIFSDLFTKSGSVDVARQKFFKNAKKSAKVPVDNAGFCYEQQKWRRHGQFYVKVKW